MRLFYEVDLFFFSIDGDIDIVDEEIFSFDVKCDPGLGHISTDPNLPDGTLVLNADEFANRRPIDPGEINSTSMAAVATTV
ncbi:MAG: hypothetical protein O3A00_08935 [Planctomycetota bacterium]|nr:hypothetical protein [Planctomycetota bacterium]